jgi:hypothetical protein
VRGFGSAGLPWPWGSREKPPVWFKGIHGGWTRLENHHKNTGFFALPNMKLIDFF